VQINLRLRPDVVTRIDRLAETLGQSRNGLIGAWVFAELVAAEREVAQAERHERQSDRPHRHHFEKVTQTEAPGRLLGTTEATYECVCGKSERRKVT
jgi:predicted transcriptional regulator